MFIKCTLDISIYFYRIACIQMHVKIRSLLVKICDKFERNYNAIIATDLIKINSQ